MTKKIIQKQKVIVAITLTCLASNPMHTMEPQKTPTNLLQKNWHETSRTCCEQELVQFLETNNSKTLEDQNSTEPDSSLSLKELKKFNQATNALNELKSSDKTNCFNTIPCAFIKNKEQLAVLVDRHDHVKNHQHVLMPQPFTPILSTNQLCNEWSNGAANSTLHIEKPLQKKHPYGRILFQNPTIKSYLEGLKKTTNPSFLQPLSIDKLQKKYQPLISLYNQPKTSPEAINTQVTRFIDNETSHEIINSLTITQDSLNLLKEKQNTLKTLLTNLKDNATTNHTTYGLQPLFAASALIKLLHTEAINHENFAPISPQGTVLFEQNDVRSLYKSMPQWVLNRFPHHTKQTTETLDSFIPEAHKTLKVIRNSLS